jgi:hypothetical protein
MQPDLFGNPFRPSAGHYPPYLAGRTNEQEEFRRLLGQNVVTENLILTGLRGVGKTVLLTHLKPIALQQGWICVGDDFTEQASLTEERVATRLITDLSVHLGQLVIRTQVELPIGFIGASSSKRRPLGHKDLQALYDNAPGMVSDKLKTLLREVGKLGAAGNLKGIVFAYDEAQNLSDHSDKDQYPLSLLLDVFQSLQRSPGGIPFLLVLTGLPTLIPKLTAARTFSERMFHTIFLDRLTPDEARDAITVPIRQDNCPVHFSDATVSRIIEMSAGYPYFIQFICREIFDIYLGKLVAKQEPIIPESELMRKLDQNFFSRRWELITDAQRMFLKVVAQLENCEGEFTSQDIAKLSKLILEKPYSNSSITQFLTRLAETGLVYKNRRGKYQFAVPLLSRFIKRQAEDEFNLPPRFRTSSGA